MVEAAGPERPDRIRVLRWGLWVVLACTAAAAMVPVLQSGRRPHGTVWIAAIVGVAWILLPYVALYAIGRTCRTVPQAVVVLIGAILIGSSAPVVYYLALFVYPDPQSGMVLAVFPFYQLLACGLVGLVRRAVR